MINGGTKNFAIRVEVFNDGAAVRLIEAAFDYEDFDLGILGQACGNGQTGQATTSDDIVDTGVRNLGRVGEQTGLKVKLLMGKLAGQCRCGGKKKRPKGRWLHDNDKRFKDDENGTPNRGSRETKEKEKKQERGRESAKERKSEREKGRGREGTALEAGS